MKSFIFLLISLLGLLFSTPIFGQDKPIRIFISADMEGIAGAIEPNQIIDGGMEYQKFRENSYRSIPCTETWRSFFMPGIFENTKSRPKYYL